MRPALISCDLSVGAARKIVFNTISWIAFAQLLFGCSLDRELAFDPKMQHILDNAPPFAMLVGECQNGGSKVARNKIISRLMLLDDRHFETYAASMTSARSEVDLAGNIATAGLTAGAIAADSQQASRVLASIASAISTARVAASAKFIAEQATPALIAKMRAQRAEIELKIHRKFALSLNEYPLEEAIRDFFRYYAAGKISTASQSLTMDAESQRIQADEMLWNYSAAKILTDQVRVSPKDRKVESPTMAKAAPLPVTNISILRTLLRKFESTTEDRAVQALERDNSRPPPGNSTAQPSTLHIPAREELARCILERAGEEPMAGSSAIQSLRIIVNSSVEINQQGKLIDSLTYFLSNKGLKHSPVVNPGTKSDDTESLQKLDNRIQTLPMR